GEERGERLLQRRERVRRLERVLRGHRRRAQELPLPVEPRQRPRPPHRPLLRAVPSIEERLVAGLGEAPVFRGLLQRLSQLALLQAPPAAGPRGASCPAAARRSETSASTATDAWPPAHKAETFLPPFPSYTIRFLATGVPPRILGIKSTRDQIRRGAGFPL
ncbi:unnamed protein product, partial [Urochloa humidicola]